MKQTTKFLIACLFILSFKQASAQVELGLNLSGIAWPQNQLYTYTGPSGISYSPTGVGFGAQCNIILHPKIRLGLGMEYISGIEQQSDIIENIYGYNYEELIRTKTSGLFLRADFEYAFINNFKGNEGWTFYGMAGGAINLYSYFYNENQTPLDTSSGGALWQISESRLYVGGSLSLGIGSQYYLENGLSFYAELRGCTGTRPLISQDDIGVGFVSPSVAFNPPYLDIALGLKFRIGE